MANLSKGRDAKQWVYRCSKNIHDRQAAEELPDIYPSVWPHAWPIFLTHTLRLAMERTMESHKQKAYTPAPDDHFSYFNWIRTIDRNQPGLSLYSLPADYRFAL